MNPQPVNEKIGQATDRAAEAVRHAADTTLQGAQSTISSVRSTAEKATDKVGQMAQQTRDSANAQLDKAAEAVDAMRADIDPTINELAAKAQALAERSINYCAHTGERLRQQVDTYTQATTRYVVDLPAKSMLIAFGSGAALATLLILATRGRND